MEHSGLATRGGLHHLQLEAYGGRAGEVEISSLKPNDASWVQKLHLTPGWYHFTSSMRTEGVPTGNTGAYISILEDGNRLGFSLRQQQLAGAGLLSEGGGSGRRRRAGLSRRRICQSQY